MGASRTAEYVALYRALESQETRRTPLFLDPLAASFLSPTLRLALQACRVPVLRDVLERYADARAPGARTSAIGRTRFIDDVVAQGVAAGVRQVVLLGAGYDCRAYRLPELADSTVFEVDRVETQAIKRARTGVGARPVAAVRYVSVDFGTDDLAERLRAAGWSESLRTTFIWEGVTNYLTESAVREVLRFVASAAAESRIVFTYVHTGVIDGSVRFDGADRLVDNVRRLGEPWQFGLHPDRAAEFLAEHGLHLEQNVSADAYRRRYLGEGDRDLQGYGFYRIAVARVEAPPSAAS